MYITWCRVHRFDSSCSILVVSSSLVEYLFFTTKTRRINYHFKYLIICPNLIAVFDKQELSWNVSNDLMTSCHLTDNRVQLIKNKSNIIQSVWYYAVYAIYVTPTMQ